VWLTTLTCSFLHPALPYSIPTEYDLASLKRKLDDVDENVSELKTGLKRLHVSAELWISSAGTCRPFLFRL
jgi:hypothetical protein